MNQASSFICSDLVTFPMPDHAKKTSRQIIVLLFQDEHDGIINWSPQKYLVDRIEMILTSLRILFSFTQGRDRCALAIWETWLVWRTTVRVHYVNDRNLLYLPLYFTADLGETKTLCGWLLQQRGAATTPHAPLSSKATNL